MSRQFGTATPSTPGEGKDGDKAAGDEFDAFALYWRDRLMHLMDWKGNRPVCEEAVSETLLVAFHYWDKVQKYERPLGWLLTVARQRQGTLLTKAGKRRTREEPAPSGRWSAQWSTVDHAPLVVSREAVRAAVRKLPLRQREAMVLHYWCSYSTAEIARHQETAESTVRSNLRHGRKKLAEVLGTTFREEDV